MILPRSNDVIKINYYNGTTCENNNAIIYKTEYRSLHCVRSLCKKDFKHIGRCDRDYDYERTVIIGTTSFEKRHYKHFACANEDFEVDQKGSGAFGTCEKVGTLHSRKVELIKGAYANLAMIKPEVTSNQNNFGHGRLVVKENACGDSNNLWSNVEFLALNTCVKDQIVYEGMTYNSVLYNFIQDDDSNKLSHMLYKYNDCMFNHSDGKSKLMHSYSQSCGDNAGRGHEWTQDCSSVSSSSSSSSSNKSKKFVIERKRKEPGSYI